MYNKVNLGLFSSFFCQQPSCRKKACTFINSKGKSITNIFFSKESNSEVAVWNNLALIVNHNYIGASVSVSIHVVLKASGYKSEWSQK